MEPSFFEDAINSTTFKCNGCGKFSGIVTLATTETHFVLVKCTSFPCSYTRYGHILSFEPFSNKLSAKIKVSMIE